MPKITKFFLILLMVNVLLSRYTDVFSALQVFDGGSFDVGNSAQQTNDGGFIVVGSTQSFGAGASDVLLTKFYSNGSLEWAKTFGGSSEDTGFSAEQTFDGGYIVTGSTESFGAGVRDVLVAKFDDGGTVEWVRTLGGINFDEAYSVQQTFDGGFIVVGQTWSFGAGSSDILLVKLYTNGSLEWVRTLGGFDADGGNSVQLTSDDGYVVAGKTNSFGGGDVFLLKFNSDGSLEWAKTFGGSSFDAGYSVQQTNDGRFILTGTYAGMDSFFGIIVDSSSLFGPCAWEMDVTDAVFPFLGYPDVEFADEPVLETKLNSTHYNVKFINTSSFDVIGLSVTEMERCYGACNGVVANDSDVCSSSGMCTLEYGCVCDEGIYGVDCEVRVCFGKFSNTSEACGEYGNCFATDSCWCKNPNFYFDDSEKECEMCPLGTVYVGGIEVVGTPTKNITNCETCPWGDEADAEEGVCITCVTGTKFDEDSWRCLDCPIGYYGFINKSDGNLSCIACPPGEYVMSTRTGLTSKNDCWAPLGVSSMLISLGGVFQDKAYSIQQTIDGGFVVTGETGSFGTGGLLVAKFYNNGSVEWLRTLSGSSLFPTGSSVQQTRDGGFIVVGHTWLVFGSKDIFLVKLYDNGSIEWIKVLGGPDSDNGLCVQQTDDDGYIITGSSEIFGNESDVLLVKLYRNGSLEWAKTLPGSGPYEEDEGKSVQQTADGGYIVTAVAESFGALSKHVLLAKFHNNGSVEWTKVLVGVSNFEGGSFVQQTSDNGFIVTGFTNNVFDGVSQRDVLLAKYLANGSVEWVHVLGGFDLDEGCSVQQTNDEGYIVTGYTRSFGEGYSDVFLAKFYANGSVDWVKTKSGSGSLHYDEGHSVQQTIGGGFVATGRMDYFDRVNIFLLYSETSDVDCFTPLTGFNSTFITASSDSVSVTESDWVVGREKWLNSSVYSTSILYQSDLGPFDYIQLCLSSYDCYGTSGNDSTVCSGKGICASTDECYCDVGYENSSTCAYTCYGHLFSDTSEVCEGDGDCIGYDTCNCHYGFGGHECQYFECYGISANKGDEVCGGHGTCVGIDRCECDVGYATYAAYGACAYYECGSRPFNATDVCSGKGNCTGSHNCECSSEFTGDDCEILYEPCPDNCDGRGICLGVETCQCNVPDKKNRKNFEYHGRDCKIKVGKSLVRTTKNMFTLSLEIKQDYLNEARYDVQVGQIFNCQKFLELDTTVHSSPSEPIHKLFSNGVKCSLSDYLEFQPLVAFTQYLKIDVSHMDENQIKTMMTKNLKGSDPANELYVKVYGQQVKIHVYPDYEDSVEDPTSYTFRSFGKDDDEDVQHMVESQTEVCKDKLKLKDQCIQVYECYPDISENPNFKYFSIGFFPGPSESKFYYSKIYYRDERSCEHGVNFEEYKVFALVSCYGSPHGDNFVMYERCRKNVGSIFFGSAVIGYFSLAAVPMICCVLPCLCIFCVLCCINCCIFCWRKQIRRGLKKAIQQSKKKGEEEISQEELEEKRKKREERMKELTEEIKVLKRVIQYFIINPSILCFIRNHDCTLQVGL